MLVNAYILHRKFAPRQEKCAHMDIRQVIFLALVESATDASRRQKKGRKSAEMLGRVTERHFIEPIQPKPGAKKQRVVRDCVVCNPKAKNRF